MTIRVRHVVAAITAAATLQLTLPCAAAGQAPPAPAGAQAAPAWPPPGPTPRTPDGKPDFTGNWQPNAIRQNVDMIGAGVEVPMLPEAKAIYDKRKAALGREDPEAR